MIELFNNSEEEKKYISNFIDPFNKKGINRITFYIWKSSFDGSIDISANIDFKIGNTEGKHIIKASTFPELIKCVNEFINNIN